PGVAGQTVTANDTGQPTRAFHNVLPDAGGCISDHLNFLRYDSIHDDAQGAANPLADVTFQTSGQAVTYHQFFEWFASLHPYEFVELEADIDPSTAHTVTDV